MAKNSAESEVHIYLGVNDPVQIGWHKRISRYDRGEAFLVVDKPKDPDRPEKNPVVQSADKEKLLKVAKGLSSNSLVVVFGTDSVFTACVRQLKRVAIRPFDTDSDKKGCSFTVDPLQLELLIKGEWL